MPLTLGRKFRALESPNSRPEVEKNMPSMAKLGKVNVLPGVEDSERLGCLLLPRIDLIRPEDVSRKSQLETFSEAQHKRKDDL
ncbi:hypothetical protein E4U13_007270 [Claviceps humidiphila]|uniref:Uncharacterized protein n=1 Tax=Claviceps humidiphila TaxID=1294629 RepID=A0A9P7TY82_9HYPO|nr:hypothetical protein E4U13_007270 [Claviceps humidiphila]